MTGVSGLAGDPAYPDKQPMMPLPLGRSGAALARELNKLGWHWWPSDSAIASQDYEGRGKCINLGHCTAGCAQGAKASVDITYWPRRSALGSSWRTAAGCSEITAGATGLASVSIYLRYRRHGAFQSAEMVIVACNGIGTPRIMFNSRCPGRLPNGIANSAGLVGRNLMFHPFAHLGLLPTSRSTVIRCPGNCIWSQEFYRDRRDRGFVRGFTLQFYRGQVTDRRQRSKV